MKVYISTGHQRYWQCMEQKNKISKSSDLRFNMVDHRAGAAEHFEVKYLTIPGY